MAQRSRPFVLLVAFAVLVAGVAPSVWAENQDPRTPDAAAFAALARAETEAVVEIVDGDTLVLADGRQVRLVGIQAPKLPLGRRNFPKWPLADMAKEVLASLVLDRDVSLRYGGREIDRHGRRLAHLLLEDGRWVQAAILRRGLARVYSFADNRALVAEMLTEEGAARAAGRGIWAHPYYAIRDPGAVHRDLGTFQLVEGMVLDAAEVRGTVYLNFGEDWRTDFTVSVRGSALRLFRREGLEPLALEGSRVRVRGWLDNRNGPAIEATHPEQIEILTD